MFSGFKGAPPKLVLTFISLLVTNGVQDLSAALISIDFPSYIEIYLEVGQG
jgi:hypothetical protein